MLNFEAYSNHLKLYSAPFQLTIKRYNRYRRILDVNNIHLCNRYENAIVVLLNDFEIIPFIKKNYYFLNFKYYDRLIFFNTETTRIGFYKNITFELVNVKYLWEDYPIEFNSSQKNKVKKKRSEWGYQQMIRFFFKNIFTLKTMCNVKWYMRLDSDSILKSSHNPFSMANDSIIYVYNNFFPSRNFDDFRLTIGMKTFLNEFINYYKIIPKNINNWKKMFCSKRTRTYYNNLEIVNMNFFLSKNVQKFINVIDLSYNIYLRSWGDAPLRYATMSLYAYDYEILPFKKSNYWYYWHDPN